MSLVKAIKINDRLFPWSEALASSPGAVEVEVPQHKVFVKSNVGLNLKMSKSQKPGPGWIKNKHGYWVKGVYKGHKGRHFAKDLPKIKGKANESSTDNRSCQTQTQ